MQIMSFNNINYISSITLTNDNDHLEFSHNKNTLIFQEISKDQEATPYKEYYLIFEAKAGMTIKLTPIILSHKATKINSFIKNISSF